MHWSFDTESGGTVLSPDGKICTDDSLKNRVVTTAPIGCRKIEDVVLLVADPEENVYDLFAKWFFSSTTEEKRVFHVWNLGWEWKPLMKWWLESEFYTEGGASAVVTPHEIYSLELTLGERKIKFVDDNCHYHSSVKIATDELIKLPKYEKIMKNAGLHGKEKKEVENLHEIWYFFGGEVRKVYLHYAKVDAFCQALCSEHLFDTGRFCTPNSFEGMLRKPLDSYDCGLSASSAGAREAKALCLWRRHYRDIPKMADVERIAKSDDPKKVDAAISAICRKLDTEWARIFGTPDRETRIVIERNLRGGLVWGVVGVHQGKFYHYDYKSSYPYEYAYGKQPFGTGTRWEKSKNGFVSVKNVCVKTRDPEKMQRWINEFDTDRYQIFIVGKIKFSLKSGYIPFISVKDCEENGQPLKRYGFDGAKKLHAGETQTLLWTLEEWKLLKRNYHIIDETIVEMWISNARTGWFTPAIKEFFDGKENSKGLTRALHKLDLNGGCHGKMMQKYLTNDVVELDGWHLHRVGTAMDVVEKINPKTNPLVGLTAMSHARCRLIEHCDIVTEAGYRILMTDTDSMITDCPPDVLRTLLTANGWKDWVIPEGEKRMEKTLGRFELEGPESSIDEFRCWGLKRYAEFTQTSEGVKVRKSAFAGMHDEDQKKLLIKPYSEHLEWTSTGKKWVGECYAIRPHPVIVDVEDVFADLAYRDGRKSDFVGRLEVVKKCNITI